MITELSKRFCEAYAPRIRLLQKEWKELRSYRSYARGEPHQTQELIEDTSHFGNKKALDAEGQTFEVTFMRFPYLAERQELYLLIDDLYQKNQPDFPSRESVFMLFAKATLDGDLRPLVRVIEKTYGQGSFKKLAQEKDFKPYHHS